MDKVVKSKLIKLHLAIFLGEYPISASIPPTKKRKENA